MQERIDAFTHVIPENFLAEMQAVNESPKLLELTEVAAFTDPAVRLEDMDEFGIDRQVITLARPEIWRGMTPGDALPLVQLANDEVRAMADEHPDRFIPVATLPFVGDAYVEEFDRCISDLDMAGIQLFSNIGDRPLDDESVTPIFERADRHDVPIWLHPLSLESWPDWVHGYEIGKIFGWPFETTVAVSRLVFSGVLERYDLDLITHHTGGMISHFADRIKTIAELGDVTGIEWEHLEQPAREYFRDIYADTAMGGFVSPLECAVEFYRADRMVYATDYPFGDEAGRRFLRECTEAVERMALDEAEQAKVFADNLTSLLP